MSSDDEIPNAAAEADIARVAAALDVIPNNGLDWNDWNRVGMATWRATGGSAEGFEAFKKWSAKSRKYDAAQTVARWKHYFKWPPNRLGFGTLHYLADMAAPGWREQATQSRGEDPEPEKGAGGSEKNRRRGKQSANAKKPGNGCVISEHTVARAFTEEHSDRLRYDHHIGKWFCWDEQIWQCEETNWPSIGHEALAPA